MRRGHRIGWTIAILGLGLPLLPVGAAESSKVTSSAAARAPGPRPGDVYREYRWFHEKGDAGQALRVGGKEGDHHPDRGWAHGYVNAPVLLPHELDLEGATRAEVVVEKVLCHDGTRGLALRLNGREWIPVPEAGGIPAPQWEYQHHTYPIVEVPLAHLRAGAPNELQMRVSPEHPWKWPQNLINGAHIRIYYDPDRKAHPTGRIRSPGRGARLGLRVDLQAEAETRGDPIDRVEWIGRYLDVNLEGDGEYTQWHHHYLHGKLQGHIGAAREPPYAVVWDTSWVPDQDAPFEVAARIVDSSGLTFVTGSADGLRLDRPGHSVELSRPYAVPTRWVTRSGSHEERFRIEGDLSRAVAFQLVWSSWSPGYMEGISINGTRVFDREGPRYATYHHRVTIRDPRPLRPGENVLETGKTPLHDGNMVHGMEVNWPGIMVLVQYRDPGSAPE